MSELYWQDPASGPRDGKLVLLLVQPDRGQWTPFDDSMKPYTTLGFNNSENTGEDRWQFAGWDWNQDQICEGFGKVIGWTHMPQIFAPPARDYQRIVKLYTNSLRTEHYLGMARVPAFVTGDPDIVQWGDRTFRRHAGAEAVEVGEVSCYVEAFSLGLSDNMVEIHKSDTSIHDFAKKVQKEQAEIREAREEDPLTAVRQKAYLKGQEARKGGRDVTDDNPYFKGTIEFSAFIDGWNDQDEDML